MKVPEGRHTRAGRGTRFLPANKAMPKEVLPLVDKPIIQYVVEEAVAAGIVPLRCRLQPGVSEGSAVEDAMHPDRIVIGARSDRDANLMKELYRTFDAPVVVTDPRSAEMIKYAANAFLAVKISFINEIAGLCERIDGDVLEVARGIGLDPRIGSAAGPGP